MNLMKYVQVLYAENYKTDKKKLKNKLMDGYSVFIDLDFSSSQLI